MTDRTVYIVQWSESEKGVISGLEHGIVAVYDTQEDAETRVTEEQTKTKAVHYFAESWPIIA